MRLKLSVYLFLILPHAILFHSYDPNAVGIRPYDVDLLGVPFRPF